MSPEQLSEVITAWTEHLRETEEVLKIKLTHYNLGTTDSNLTWQGEALTLAAIRGNLTEVSRLLEEGASWDAEDRRGYQVDNNNPVTLNLNPKP